MTVPCFDPGCPCCSVHTPLHRRREDEIERLQEACREIERFVEVGLGGEEAKGVGSHATYQLVGIREILRRLA